ncbi:PepSY domain-containing protein [Streptomyces pinistramenti]|uniref:PepSY domain-containing protein n=1 Tax=Streptomyces pinistramenti TaxID=2884812 RepID=UPI001D0739FF|nr:PepSY domain-containing protein [Streptomyces pinistramenti]MCB5906599.1 PepSY domain-containing protein [Streptomyces pinistramenti]
MDTKSTRVVTRSMHPVGPRAIGLVCAVATAGALLAGCGSGTGKGAGNVKSGPGSPAAEEAAAASPSGSANPSKSGSLTKDQTERKALISKAKVTYDKALTSALAAVPHAKAVSADLEDHHGKTPTWDVDAATSDGTVHQVHVDAVTGKADKPSVKSGQSKEDKSKLAERLGKATVTAQQAAQTATAKKKGTVTGIKLGKGESGGSASPSSSSSASSSPGSASPSAGGGGAAAWSVDVVSSKDWKKTTFGIDAADKKILREHVG